MKLSLQAYRWITSNEIPFTEEEEEKVNKLFHSNYKECRKYIDKLAAHYNETFSYIDIIDPEYEMLYEDREKNYKCYKAIIKIENKYYSFKWNDSSNFIRWEDKFPLDKDLKEVFPHTETITKYY